MGEHIACCLVDRGCAEQHARLGDIETAQDVLDLARLRTQDARQRSGRCLGLP